MANSRIITVIDNVHMGLSHDGLCKLATKLRKDPKTLEPGELILFLNRGRDKLKTLGAGGIVIGYLKMPNKRKIMLDAIQFLPQTFGAKGFDYDGALSMAIDKALQNKIKDKESPFKL
jgi:hypothetical protein